MYFYEKVGKMEAAGPRPKNSEAVIASVKGRSDLSVGLEPLEDTEAVVMTPGGLGRQTHVAGLILARGGSQGIPLKNIAPLGGRPLLEWALGAMLNFGGFDSLWVSTDHPGIATCAAGQGALVFPRSARLAGPEVPSIEAVLEFLQSHPEVEVVALVQCTSPFLRPGMKKFFCKVHLISML